MISKISRGYIVALENSVPPRVTTNMLVTAGIAAVVWASMRFWCKV
jgi:hypothetical protein